MSEEQLILPIIDSHVHLFRTRDVPNLNWADKEHVLAQTDHHVNQYKEAAKSAPSLLGFVYVETDVNYDLASGVADGSGWEQPIEEVRRTSRLALGKPDEAESDDFTAEDAKLCMGIIPWAPIPSGAEAMEKYISAVKEAAGEAWPRIKGFRYLVQDKPHGTMLDDKFVESLKLLGRKGLIFEVGVDHHRRGKKQLEELVAMIDQAHDGVPEEERVTFIINHLLKPDLSILNIHSDPNFHAWRTTIYTLGKCSRTYMKLSGAFSEMPDSLKITTTPHIFEATLAWLGIVLATFGSSRIMFGSDWPVCEVGVGPGAWTKWREVVDKMCWMASLDDEDRAMIFGGTAKKAYGL